MRILGPTFPSDRAMCEVAFRVRRIGRDEWLDDHANPTEDPEAATLFGRATDAALFTLEHVDEPRLWTWEPVAVVA